MKKFLSKCSQFLNLEAPSTPEETPDPDFLDDTPESGTCNQPAVVPPTSPPTTAPASTVPEPDIPAQPPEAMPPQPIRPTAPASNAPQRDDAIQAIMGILRKTADHLQRLGESLCRCETSLLDHNAKAAELIADQTRTIGGMAKQIKDLEENSVREFILKPVVSDLILLRDSIINARRRLSSNMSTQPLALSEDVLSGTDATVLSLLTRYGVTQIVIPGTSLDTRCQKVVSVDRQDAPKDGEVIARPLPGYEIDGHLFRPEQVVVRKVNHQQKGNAP